MREETPPKAAPEVLNGIRAEHEYFLSCLRKGAGMFPDLIDAGKSMRLAEAINRGLRFRA
jgi:hypothetical protein